MNNLFLVKINSVNSTTIQDKVLHILPETQKLSNYNFVRMQSMIKCRFWLCFQKW